MGEEMACRLRSIPEGSAEGAGRLIPEYSATGRDVTQDRMRLSAATRAALSPLVRPDDGSAAVVCCAVGDRSSDWDGGEAGFKSLLIFMTRISENRGT